MKPFPEIPLLSGPMKPMRFEADVNDCMVVKGEIPKDINGGFYRCGPAMKRLHNQGCMGFGVQDGMVQGMVFENGKAHFKNRWVQTPRYLLEEKYDESIFKYADAAPEWWSYGMGEPVRDERTAGVPSGTPWINAVPFAGDKVLAISEINCIPYEIDPISLETRGPVSWANHCGSGLIEKCTELDGTFCPHPKWDHETGEMYGWSATDRAPYCKVLKVSPDGSVKTRDLDCADQLWESNLHDAWLTKDYLVFAFQPFTNHRDNYKTSTPMLSWDSSKSVTLVFVPRSLDGEIRVIKASDYPGCQVHTLSANTEGNIITLDAPLYDKAPFPFKEDMQDDGTFPPFPAGLLGRWTVDLDNGSLKAAQLSDRIVEFPKIDDRYYGKNYTYGFMLSGDNMLSLDTLMKRNMHTGAEETFTRKTEAPVAMFEGTFVPRSGSAVEGDGYFIIPVSRFLENKSEYLIFDTSDVSAGPVAEIELPFQIGWTPHGNFLNFA